MEELFAKVKHLVKHKAVHRRGWRITELSNMQTAIHLVSEAAEVADAISLKEQLDVVVDELGDTLACLVHLCVGRGITEQQLIAAALKKLGQRFTLETKHA
jgi:NTP pyrophosphatase (non-canonical NTP hydrolase)